MGGKLVPKHLTKGVDIFGVKDCCYIVRSDLRCYMKSSNINRGEIVAVYSLHPSCRDGDHYLAHKDDLFYIIKGDSFRCVTNINTDENAAVYSLHPNCQGGDFYLSAWNKFYIIFENRGVYRVTKNLNEDEDGQEYTLHPNCRNGLYYFGFNDQYCFVKQVDQWGVQYVRTSTFHENLDTVTISIHPSVINFLPGGLGITKGPAYGEWTCIKTINNDSHSPVTWQKRVNKKVGFEKQKMSSIEDRWNVSATVSSESGGLTASIAQCQFALSTEHGGTNVNTTSENWSEATEVEETVTVTLQPNEKLYIWAFRLGLGDMPLLHCRDMRILDTPDPPTDVPLSPA